MPDQPGTPIAKDYSQISKQLIGRFCPNDPGIDEIRTGTPFINQRIFCRESDLLGASILEKLRRSVFGYNLILTPEWIDPKYEWALQKYAIPAFILIILIGFV